MDIPEQIESIQKEIRETPYHKGTEHHIGMLRARIAKLKDRLIESNSKSKGGGGGGYAVKKQGDATVVLIGPPSVGKSTLINGLTNAQSRVAPYAFTTVSVIPGMMEYNDARIQILDVPGLIEGAEEGKGRGREVLSVVRGTDLLVLITEPKKLEAFQRIKLALERNGIRIDKYPPKVTVEKKLYGGVVVHSNLKQELSKDTIKAVAYEYGIKNGEITLKEKVSIDRLIDAFSTSRVYIPSIEVINKIDEVDENIKLNLENKGNVVISAEKNLYLDVLRQAIWQKLNFVRIYLIPFNEEPSYNNPLVVPAFFNLNDVSLKIGNNFTDRINGARIWGKGSKFPGQEVSLSLQVQEGMQIRFV